MTTATITKNTEELPLEMVVTAPLFDGKGLSQGTIELDPEVFGILPNMSVLHQVVTGLRAAYRVGTASTKTRAEVRGGGKKPWRQKGTGRARHGSIRSPIWVGGGIAHGPKPRNYQKHTPKKMKRLALRSALSARASEQAIYVLEPPGWETPKTKSAIDLITTLEIAPKILLIVPDQTGVLGRSFRNLTDIRICSPQRLTAYEVLWASCILLTTDALTDVNIQATDRKPDSISPDQIQSADEAVELTEAEVSTSVESEEEFDVDTLDQGQSVEVDEIEEPGSDIDEDLLENQPSSAEMGSSGPAPSEDKVPEDETQTGASVEAHPSNPAAVSNDQDASTRSDEVSEPSTDDQLEVDLSEDDQVRSSAPEPGAVGPTEPSETDEADTSRTSPSLQSPALSEEKDEMGSKPSSAPESTPDSSTELSAPEKKEEEEKEVVSENEVSQETGNSGSSTDSKQGEESSK